MRGRGLPRLILDVDKLSVYRGQAAVTSPRI